MRSPGFPFRAPWVACGITLAACGCSRGPVTRFDLCGEVTFKGQPVPAGLVVINPDLANGGDGPQGMAEIRAGRYDTRTCHKGAPAGPVVLMIDGFDGLGQPESPLGSPLFTGYRLPVALPREATELNIDVPASATTGSAKVVPQP